MTNQVDALERRIRVDVRQHRGSDLLLGTSDDLRGLTVVGRSDDDLKIKIPGSVTEILNAQGLKVMSVTAQREETAGDFVGRGFIAKAKLAAV